MNESTQQMAVNQIEVIKAQSAAAFALTPIGQQIKQFETQQRMAKMYSESTIVPDTYKGNLGNCVIALDMAMRMNANPLMIMQGSDTSGRELRVQMTGPADVTPTKPMTSSRRSLCMVSGFPSEWQSQKVGITRTEANGRQCLVRC